jgi:GTP-binding protein
VDVSGTEGRDPIADFEAINAELRKYSPDLAARPQMVAANKCDLLGDNREPIDKLREYVTAQGYDFYELSAAATTGTRELMRAAAGKLKSLPPVLVYEPDYVPSEELPGSAEDIVIEEEDGVWYAEGEWLRRLVASVNFDDYESRMYFDRAMRDGGVFDRMEALGVRDGDTVNIYGLEFDYKS